MGKSLLSWREVMADESAYLLIYLLQLVLAELHIKFLSLFGAITRLDDDHPLHRLASGT